MPLVRPTDLGGVIPAINAMADQLERWARGELPPVVDPKVLGSWLEVGGVTTAALATGGVTLGKLATSYSDAPPGYLIASGSTSSPIGILTANNTEANALTLVTAGSFTADGTRPVAVTFFAPSWNNGAPGFNLVKLSLFDNGVSQGQIAQHSFAAQGDFTGPVGAATKYTPSAGAHTLSIRGWNTVGPTNVSAGAGGAGNWAPMVVLVQLLN